MISTLSFNADPPQPYHTFSYHRKKAIREGYQNPDLDLETQSNIIKDTLFGLIDLFEIPSDYHFILLKDNDLLYKMLVSIVPAGISVAGSSVFADIQNKYKDKIVFLPDPKKDLSRVKIAKMPLFIQDIDLMTGREVLHTKLTEILDLNNLPFIHQDISYSSPTYPLDFDEIDSFCFQTGYGFGMSQDLVVWILRSDLFNKVIRQFDLRYMDLDPGSSKTRKYFIQDKLEIYRIYILGMIVQDFLNRSLSIIRNEIKYKSIILYNSINDNPNLEPLVKDQSDRSQNIICAKTNVKNEKVLNFMSENRIEFDVLRDPGNSTTIRIANYPLHSKEQMEYLADLMVKL